MIVKKFDSIQLGANIKKIRKAAGFKRAQLGDMLGVSHDSIRNYENGATIPDPIKLLIIADLGHVTVDELLCHQPEPALHRRKEFAMLLNDLRAVLRRYEKCLPGSARDLSTPSGKPKEEGENGIDLTGPRPPTKPEER